METVSKEKVGTAMFSTPRLHHLKKILRPASWVYPICSPGRSARCSAFRWNVSPQCPMTTKYQIKRIVDIILCSLLLIVFAFPMALIALAVMLTSKGPVLYWLDRVGRWNRIFKMPKFRSMCTDAPQVATHLLSDPGSYLTCIGGFLRRSSLDELPQLLSVLRGDLSLVGPRPALFNQDDLIELRTKYGVEQLTPGITGWAQVNGRDDLPIPDKVRLDCEYLCKHSLRFDIYIIVATVCKVIRSEGISH